MMEQQTKLQAIPAVGSKAMSNCRDSESTLERCALMDTDLQRLPPPDALVKRIARRVCRRVRLDPGAVEDLTQSFYALFLERASQGKLPGTSLEQYATHLMYEASKPLCTMQRQMIRERGPEGADVSNLSGQLQSKVEIRQELGTYQDWLDAVESLCESLRQPALRVWVDGLSVNQTAQVLNITPNATSLRLMRAWHLVARSVRLNPHRRRGDRHPKGRMRCSGR
jgi:DNA-directed RNA polymerase specialized sigma24 family protein